MRLRLWVCWLFLFSTSLVAWIFPFIAFVSWWTLWFNWFFLLFLLFRRLWRWFWLLLFLGCYLHFFLWCHLLLLLDRIWFLWWWTLLLWLIWCLLNNYSWWCCWCMWLLRDGCWLFDLLYNNYRLLFLVFRLWLSCIVNWYFAWRTTTLNIAILVFICTLFLVFLLHCRMFILWCSVGISIIASYRSIPMFTCLYPCIKLISWACIGLCTLHLTIVFISTSSVYIIITFSCIFGIIPNTVSMFSSIGLGVVILILWLWLFF